MKHIALSALLLLTGLALEARAQTLQPGLWEIGNRVQSGSGEMEEAMAEMQKQMADLTPEQRKIMQDMLAKQGVGMTTNGPAGVSMRICLTQEMLDRNEIAPQQGDCKSSYGARTGNSMKISFVCAKPPSTGEVQISFVSPQAYTSKTVVTTVSNGKNERISIDGRGQWLSTDCGSIKPMVAPKQ